MLSRAKKLYLYFLLALIFTYVGITLGPIIYFTPGKNSRDIEIFTTVWCGHCARLRTYLTKNEIPFRETDVEKTIRGEFAMDGLKARGIPFSVIGTTVIYGVQKSEIEFALRELGYEPTIPFDK